MQVVLWGGGLRTRGCATQTSCQLVGRLLRRGHGSCCHLLSLGWSYGLFSKLSMIVSFHTCSCSTSQDQIKFVFCNANVGEKLEAFCKHYRISPSVMFSTDSQLRFGKALEHWKERGVTDQKGLLFCLSLPSNRQYRPFFLAHPPQTASPPMRCRHVRDVLNLRVGPARCKEQTPAMFIRIAEVV